MKNGMKKSNGGMKKSGGRKPMKTSGAKMPMLKTSRKKGSGGKKKSGMKY